MTFTRLTLRSALYHWRTNLAVCLGVAAAVAVLGGALVVGDSVRGSLRELALSRLGQTGSAIVSPRYFREALAAEAAPGGSPAAPLVATTALVTHEDSGRRASSVLVYGVDERFWRFHGLAPREGVFVSPALAADLNARSDDVLLTRLQRPSEIPLESLFAQKEDIARTLRLTVSGTLPRSEMGEFALQPQQGEVRALFVPLAALQREFGVRDRVNTVLLPAALEERAAESAFREALTLEDAGARIARGAGGAIVVEGTSGILSEGLERAALDAGSALGLQALPVFTYLANTIRAGEREVPYSLVSGIPLDALRTPAAEGPAGVRSASSGMPLTSEYGTSRSPALMVFAR